MAGSGQEMKCCGDMDMAVGKWFGLKDLFNVAGLLRRLSVTTCAARPSFLLLQPLFIPHVSVSPGDKAELFYTNMWYYTALSHLQNDHVLGQMSQNCLLVTVIMQCKTVSKPQNSNRRGRQTKVIQADV